MDGREEQRYHNAVAACRQEGWSLKPAGSDTVEDGTIRYNEAGCMAIYALAVQGIGMTSGRLRLE